MAIPLFIATPSEVRNRTGAMTPTITGPVRTVQGEYGPEWYIESNTTNLVPNPRFATNATGWYSQSVTPLLETTNTVVEHTRLTTTVRLTHTGASATSVLFTETSGASANSVKVTAGATYTASLFSKVTAGRTAEFAIYYRDANGYVGSATTTLMTSSTWKRYTVTAVAPAGATHVAILVYLQGGNGGNHVSGEQVSIANVQCEALPYATSYTDGSLGTGYAWTGTAHLSTSTRARSRILLNTNIPASEGALAFRVNTKILKTRPTSKSAQLAYITSTTDDSHMDLYWSWRSATSTHVFENSYLYDDQTKSDITFPTLTLPTSTSDYITIYVDWKNGEQARAWIGPDLTGSTSRTWASSTTNLGTSIELGSYNGDTNSNFHWGAPYAGVVAFDRRLTTAERTRLFATNTPWTWNSFAPPIGGILRTSFADAETPTTKINLAPTYLFSPNESVGRAGAAATTQTQPLRLVEGKTLVTKTVTPLFVARKDYKQDRTGALTMRIPRENERTKTDYKTWLVDSPKLPVPLAKFSVYGSKTPMGNLLNTAEATTNLVPNPRLATDTTGWIAGNASLTRVTAEQGLDATFTHAARITQTGATGAYGYVTSSALTGATAGRIFTVSLHVWVSEEYSGQIFRLYGRENGGATASAETTSTFTLRAGWQRLSHTFTVVQNDRTAILLLFDFNSPAQNMTVNVTGAQIEEKNHMSEYTDTTRTRGSGITGPTRVSRVTNGRTGWFSEDSTTNYVPNPYLPNTVNYGHLTLSTLTNAAAMHPVDGYVAQTARRLTVSSAASSSSLFSMSVTAAMGLSVAQDADITISLLVRPSAQLVGKTLSFYSTEDGGTSSYIHPTQTKVLTSGWQLVTYTFKIRDAGRTGVFFYMTIPQADQTVGSTFDVTLVQAENKPYATTTAVGDRGTGYSWAGTANASASTRSLGSVSLSGSVPSQNLLGSKEGTVVLRYYETLAPVYASAPVSGANYLFLAGTWMDSFIGIYRGSNGLVTAMIQGPTGVTLSATTSITTQAGWRTIVLTYNQARVRLEDDLGNAAEVTPSTAFTLSFAGKPATLSAASSQAASVPIESILFFQQSLLPDERTYVKAMGPYDWLALNKKANTLEIGYEATTNLMTNPHLVGATGVNSYIGGVVTADTSHVEYPTAVKVVSDAVSVSGAYVSTSAMNGTSATGKKYTPSATVWGLAGVVRVQSIIYYTDATSTSGTTGTFTLSPTPQRIVFPTNFATSGKTISQVTLYFYGEANVATTFYMTNLQLEEKAYATPFASGAMGTDHAWTGAANNSTSTRVARGDASKIRHLRIRQQVSGVMQESLVALDKIFNTDAIAYNSNGTLVIQSKSPTYIHTITAYEHTMTTASAQLLTNSSVQTMESSTLTAQVPQTAWLIEESTTNLVRNPSLDANTGDWTKYSSTVADYESYRVNTQPDMGPFVYEGRVNHVTNSTHAFWIGCIGTLPTPLTGTAASFTGSVDVKASRNITGAKVHLRFTYADGTVDNTAKTINLTTEKQRIVTDTHAVTTTRTLNSLTVYVSITGLAQAGDRLWLTNGQIEQKAYATSFTSGNLGAGYAWTGTSASSTSTRDAAGVTTPYVPSANAGAIFVRFKPPEITAASNFYVFSSGASTSMFLSLALTTLKRLFPVLYVQGANVGAGIPVSASIATDASVDAVLSWSNKVVTLRASNGYKVTRDLSSMPWVQTAQPLIIGRYSSFASNSAIESVIAFDRDLTDAEAAELFAMTDITWSRFGTRIGAAAREPFEQPLLALRAAGA